MGIRTFKKGGIHYAHKKPCAAIPVREVTTPDEVVLLTGQHAGLPAMPVVKEGDLVKTGQLIAIGSSYISAHIHASVSGQISGLRPLEGGQVAITIKREGNDWAEGIEIHSRLSDIPEISRGEIIKRIQDAGIVGMGGAAFPTHVKLTIPDGRKTEYLIVNGAECEPMICADHRLMIEKTEEVLVGVRILIKALDLEKAYIAIEIDKKDAIERISGLASKYQNIHVVPLRSKYPQGSEKQIIKAITGREVPPSRLPIDAGCIVHNVATVFAVYEAVCKNKPLVERIITVYGPAITNPGNYLVRIGTPLNVILDAAGGLPEGTGKIIAGGLMMGKPVDNITTPVTKGTTGILVLPEHDVLKPHTENCIRCGICNEVCPIGLVLSVLAVLAEQSLTEKMKRNNVAHCIECGCCQYSCPAFRNILGSIRMGKVIIMKEPVVV